MRPSARRGSAEQGVALIVVIGVAVLVMILVTVVMLAARGVSERSRRDIDDTRGRSPSDLGANIYLRALNARVSGEHNDFHLPSTHPSLGAMLPAGTVRIPNASLPGQLANVDTSAATGVPSDSRTTYRSPDGGDTYSYWQMFSLVRPDWTASTPASPRSSSKVIAYFRGWSGSADLAGGDVSTVITRVEYRPTRFGDYQMIIDGQVRLGNGASVQGPVHSNGFPVSVFGAPAGAQIEAPSISCGPEARFSVTSGSYSIGGAGCTARMQRPPTGETINLKAIGAEAEFHWNLCAGSGRYESPERRFAVRCISAPGAGVTLDLAAIATHRATVVVVDGAAFVSGTVPDGRRLSVIAYDVDGGAASTGGADITLTGDVSHGPTGMLGLFAGDDVFVDVTPTVDCRVRNIDAAIIASSGGLSLPATWRVPMAPTVDAPRCAGTLDVYGAIASHFVPFLALQASDGSILVGYSGRTYRWDQQLKHAPPPAMPLVSQWQQYGYDDANNQCFDLGTQRLRSIECA